MAQGCRSKHAVSDTRMLWHNVISEPQGVLFRSIADHEVEMPSRLQGPQMLDSSGAGHRTSWLWSHRDVSFHVADSAVSSIATFSQHTATPLILSLPWLSAEVRLI